jgi:hypothetical protein
VVNGLGLHPRRERVLRAVRIERQAGQVLLAALMMKVSVTGVTAYVLSTGGAELDPVSQVSLVYCLESFGVVGAAIVIVALFVRDKAYRLVLYSFVVALTAFDLSWDLTQAFQLPIYEGILLAAFVTSAIPTFTALHVLQNRDVYCE